MLDKNVGLYTDYYELTMAQGYFLKNRNEKKAVFDYFFRENPFNGGYVVFAGLSDLLSLLDDFKFSRKACSYLKKQGFQDEFLNYLRDFQFSGDIFACPEGEVVFPREPVIRIEGNILEAQIIETLLLNIINFASLIATKASRINFAAGERQVVDFGLRRAQGTGGILASKAAVIGGVSSTSNVLSAFNYGLEATGTQAHSWVQSYEDELTAFRHFADIYPKNCVLLVDTYDTLKSGLPNAIQVAREMEERGEKLLGIRLDSGDLTQLSIKARRRLDEAGLDYVKIAASGQLDEYEIKKLIKKEAAIDLFGVGTRLITGQPDGALNGVYKLSMVEGRPTLKISEDREKIIIPGCKNIIRCRDGKMQADVIVLCNEQISEVKELFHPYLDDSWMVDCDNKEFLLDKVMSEGQTRLEDKKVSEISEYRRQSLEALPEKYKRIMNPEQYPVGISENCRKLQQKLIREKEEKAKNNSQGGF